MSWTIRVHNKAAKTLPKLPVAIQRIFEALLFDLRLNGPIAKNWPHYGKLKGSFKDGTHHCHLHKGRPTYVTVWWEVKDEEKLIEVIYVGTHEKAPY